ncbi:MAG: DUF4432 family protein [Reichenbachiella sp.]
MNENNKRDCTITNHQKVNGMDVVWLENEYLKVGVLIGRGADIFEFNYKPADLNYLLRIPGEIRNPSLDFAQKRDTNSQMEDYYYGGWQDCLPNSAPFVYRGASYGQHGEVWGVPWHFEIEENTKDSIAIKCWVRPMRTPLLIEKILTLKSGSKELNVDSKITNEGNTYFDFIWGQHIAFGLSFLEEGAEIKTNANSMMSEPAMPDKRRFKPDIESTWPEGIGLDGVKIDASKIQKSGQNPYSELTYLSGFTEGKYSILNPTTKLGFGLTWDASLFKYLWMWEERNGTQDAPWWGRVYTVALEPWTAKWTSKPEEGIKNGDWERLEASESIHTTIKASAIDKN